MAHLTVTVALLFLACVHAAPAPEPSKPKFTLAKKTAVGFGAADQNMNTGGGVDSSVGIDKAYELPVDTGDAVPDFTLLDNVNTGAAFAGIGGKASGVDVTKGTGFRF